MASVDLGYEVWVHLASDLSTYVRVAAMVTEADTVEGSVRRRAGGRFQSVRRAGQARVVNVDVDHADRDAIDTLRSWVGEPVMYRDPRYRKMWGVYYSSDITEVAAVDRALVRFALTEITHSEEV